MISVFNTRRRPAFVIISAVCPAFHAPGLSPLLPPPGPCPNHAHTVTRRHSVRWHGCSPPLPTLGPSGPSWAGPLHWSTWLGGLKAAWVLSAVILGGSLLPVVSGEWGEPGSQADRRHWVWSRRKKVRSADTAGFVTPPHWPGQGVLVFCACMPQPPFPQQCHQTLGRKVCLLPGPSPETWLGEQTRGRPLLLAPSSSGAEGDGEKGQLRPGSPGQPYPMAPEGVSS